MQCRLGVLHVMDPQEVIDYALVDFIGVHLKPQGYELSSDTVDEDYVMLFNQDALRGSVKHLSYEVSTVFG